MGALAAVMKTSGCVAVLAVTETFAGPVAVGAVLVIVLLVAALCWVVADDARAVRLSMLIQAIRSQPPSISEDAASRAPSSRPIKDEARSENDHFATFGRVRVTGR